MAVKNLLCATTAPLHLATMIVRWEKAFTHFLFILILAPITIFHQVCHERTHTEKKMECPFCEMRFCVDTSLRKHSKIHEKQLASDLKWNCKWYPAHKTCSLLTKRCNYLLPQERVFGSVVYAENINNNVEFAQIFGAFNKRFNTAHRWQIEA